MLIDDLKIHRLLVRIVVTIAGGPGLDEDLMQEAMVHLWRVEQNHPGQLTSWYLQSCRFHLLDYLRGGRSVDALKRGHLKCDLDEHVELPSMRTAPGKPDDSVLSPVCAREIFQQLFNRLRPLDRTILVRLAEGFGAREIAKKLNVTHQAVSKRRAHIASLATRLGLHL